MDKPRYTYWLGIDSQQTWEDPQQKRNMDQFGFPKARRKAVARMKKGDRIVSYMTVRKRFFAVWEIVDEYFEDPSYVRAGKAYPACVRVKELILRDPGDGIPVEQIKDKLAVFRNFDKKTWGLAVRQSAKQWEYDDGEAVLQALQKTHRNTA